MISHTEYRRLAILAALALFLSTVEYMIPKPVPFFRLGLANLPLILAVGLFPHDRVFLLGLLKVLGQGLIHGTLISYPGLLSAAGTLASISAMLILYDGLKHRISPIGLALGGAMASNLIQLILARYLYFGPGAKYLAAPLLALGTGTALLLGFFARNFMQKSLWYKKVTENANG